MALLKNKRFAAVVCVVLIVFSILFGAHRSLAAERNKVLETYTAGDENDLSITVKLASMTEYTAALLRSAGACYTQQDAVYAAVQKVYEQLLETGTPTQRRDQVAALASACTALQADLNGRSDVDEAQLRAMTRSINDIISMRDQMRHSGYNQLAEAFNNSLLASFPGGWLARLTGLKPLPLFY